MEILEQHGVEVIAIHAIIMIKRKTLSIAKCIRFCFAKISSMVQQQHPIIVIDDVRQFSDCLLEVLEAIDLIRLDTCTQEELAAIKHYCADLQNIIEQAINEIIHNSSFDISHGVLYRTIDIANIEMILYVMSVAFNKLCFVMSAMDLLMDVFDRYTTTE